MPFLLPNQQHQSIEDKAVKTNDVYENISDNNQVKFHYVQNY